MWDDKAREKGRAAREEISNKDALRFAVAQGYGRRGTGKNTVIVIKIGGQSYEIPLRRFKEVRAGDIKKHSQSMLILRSSMRMIQRDSKRATKRGLDVDQADGPRTQVGHKRLRHRGEK